MRFFPTNSAFFGNPKMLFKKIIVFLQFFSQKIGDNSPVSSSNCSFLPEKNVKIFIKKAKLEKMKFLVFSQPKKGFLSENFGKILSKRKKV